MTDPRFDLIDFGPAHRRLIAALGVLFTVAVALHLHGYSTPFWHDYLDQTPKSEIIFGKLEPARGDDFLLDLTLVLAQAHHEPRFPVVNSTIGDGMNMLAPMRVPVLHPIGLFRPASWGFWLGDSVGLSWMWWTLTLGTFYGVFLVLMLLTRSRFAWSVIGAAGFVYSPLMQTWSLHKAEIPMHAAFAFVSLVYVLLARRRPVILLNGLLAGWSAGGLLFHHIYPPIQVTVGFLFLALTAGFLWERRAALDLHGERRARLTALAAAALVPAFGALSLWWSAKDALERIVNTSYPGQRFDLGGGIPWGYLLSGNLLATVRTTHFEVFRGNVCEASYGFLFFPMTVALLALKCWRERRPPDPVPIALILYMALSLVYTYVGIPAWLGHATLWGKAVANRTQMGFLLADLFLLATVLKPGSAANMRLSLRETVVAMVPWLALIAATGAAVQAPLLGFTPGFVALLVGVNAVLGWLLTRSRRPEAFIALLLLLNVGATLRFNPLVRGGAEYIRENAISQAIMREDTAAGRGRWIVLMANVDYLPAAQLLRMLDVRSLGGYQCGPPLEAMRLLDGAGTSSGVYNQCAYIRFFTSDKDEIRFDPFYPGAVGVHISPNRPELRTLGIDHLLIAGGRLPDPVDPGLFELRQDLGRYRIYRRRAAP